MNICPNRTAQSIPDLVVLALFVGCVCKLPVMLYKQCKNKTTMLKTDDKMPTLRKNKKSCNATHKPTQIAAHFILPNRTSKFDFPTIKLFEIITLNF
jgi:hypothetical protein